MYVVSMMAADYNVCSVYDGSRLEVLRLTIGSWNLGS